MGTCTYRTHLYYGKYRISDMQSYLHLLRTALPSAIRFHLVLVGRGGETIIPTHQSFCPPGCMYDLHRDMEIVTVISRLVHRDD